MCDAIVLIRKQRRFYTEGNADGQNEDIRCRLEWNTLIRGDSGYVYRFSHKKKSVLEMLLHF